ncbi:MAG TPA: trehalose-phosphatase [Aldersonia sp.]
MTTSVLPPDVRDALIAIAHTPELLVVSDYDGTMSPIVSNPSDAVPNPASARALADLAALEHTTAAMLSGRERSVLATLSGLGDPVQLVGSHGTEFDTGFVTPLDDDDRRRLADLEREIGAIAADTPGAGTETKPASVTLHVRNADPEAGHLALERARKGPANWANVHVTEGKAVIELAVVETDKGFAIDLLRERSAATAVVFLGDDVTDEKGFSRMRDGDVGIKVGEGATLARYRVASTDDVATALRLLYDERH